MNNVSINAKKEAHDQGKMTTRNKRFRNYIKVGKRVKFISLQINVPTGNTRNNGVHFAHIIMIPKDFTNITTLLTIVAKKQ